MNKTEQDKRIQELEYCLLDLYAWAEDFSSTDIRCRIEEVIPTAASCIDEGDDE